MQTCFKSFQYFDKAEWKKLEVFLNEGLKSQRNGNDPETLKKQLEEKDKELRGLKK